MWNYWRLGCEPRFARGTKPSYEQRFTQGKTYNFPHNWGKNYFPWGWANVAFEDPSVPTRSIAPIYAIKKQAKLFKLTFIKQ